MKRLKKLTKKRREKWKPERDIFATGIISSSIFILCSSKTLFTNQAALRFAMWDMVANP